MREAAWRPLALMRAMVLFGEGICRLAGRKVRELFLDTRGDASEYDDRECLCLLPMVGDDDRMSLFRFGAVRMGRPAPFIWESIGHVGRREYGGGFAFRCAETADDFARRGGRTVGGGGGEGRFFMTHGPRPASDQ